MATIEDASMPDAVIVDTIDFSDGVLGWLHTNRQILEEKVARKQKNTPSRNGKPSSVGPSTI